MDKYSVDPQIARAIHADILQAIDSIVDRHVSDPAQRIVLKKAKSEGAMIGDYIVQQIPYAELEYIKFAPLPGTDTGDTIPDPNIDTYRVQKYGILAKFHTDAPYIPDTTDKDRERKYKSIPVGFPVEFAERRNNEDEETFGQWRFHNGVKAIRIEYQIFPGRQSEKTAHLIIFYAGGDH